MQRVLLAAAVSVVMVAAGFATGERDGFQLTGWAEIPSTYRHPGPVSGQFATGPVNGVTPPYDGQPIPGFSGMIPSRWPGIYISLPDNGFGAQPNSADFVLGVYRVAPFFKTRGNGTTSRGPVLVLGHTPFSDPDGLLSSAFITDGPVYARLNYYPPSVPPAAPILQIPVDPAIQQGRLLTGADFDVESIARMDDGTFWVGEEFGPYLLHFDARGRLLSLPVRHPVLRAPQNPQNAVLGPANLPSSRGFESMTRNGNGTKLYLTTEASIETEPDKRLLDIYEFDTRTRAVHRPQLQVREGQLRPDYRRRQQRHQHLHHRRHDPPGRRSLHHHRARRLPGAAEQRQPAAPEEALPDRSQGDRSGDRHPRGSGCWSICSTSTTRGTSAVRCPRSRGTPSRSRSSRSNR